MGYVVPFRDLGGVSCRPGCRVWVGFQGFGEQKGVWSR